MDETVGKPHKEKNGCGYSCYKNYLSCNCGRSKDRSENESIKSHRMKPRKFLPAIAPDCFVRYFHVVVLSFVGASLLSGTIQSFVRKISVYSLFMEIRRDTIFFSLPAGLLCFPTVILTLLLKSNKPHYMLTLVMVTIMANGLLFAGYFIGTVYRLKFSNETVRLKATIPREALNNTLYNMIVNYEEAPENNTALDKIHQTFTCCGIDSQNDFRVKVPDSCCPQNDCKWFEVWPYGCLRRIQQDVTWHKYATESLTQLLILMYFFNISMALTVYVSDYHKRQGMERANKRLRR